MSDPVESSQPGEVGALVERIGDGLKTIARDEVRLARVELLEQIKKPLVDAGAIVLGTLIAVIGVGLLCTTAVVALEPLIPMLWLRMAIMSLVYFTFGGAMMVLYARRFQADTASSSLPGTAEEARRTVDAVKSAVEGGGRP